MQSTAPCTKDQFYGEYLHAFEDAFAHRDDDNVPYGYKGGHLSGGHDPDHTYNANGWVVNRPRTIEMEMEVFLNFQKDFKATGWDSVGNEIAWDSFKATLESFNANTSAESNLASKIDILNSKLTNMGFNKIPVYNCESSKRLRSAYLTNNGVPFVQANYPGTILATPGLSESCK